MARSQIQANARSKKPKYFLRWQMVLVADEINIRSIFDATETENMIYVSVVHVFLTDYFTF